MLHCILYNIIQSRGGNPCLGLPGCWDAAFVWVGRRGSGLDGRGLPVEGVGFTVGSFLVGLPEWCLRQTEDGVGG